MSASALPNNHSTPCQAVPAVRYTSCDTTTPTYTFAKFRPSLQPPLFSVPIFAATGHSMLLACHADLPSPEAIPCADSATSALAPRCDTANLRDASLQKNGFLAIQTAPLRLPLPPVALTHPGLTRAGGQHPLRFAAWRGQFPTSRTVRRHLHRDL